ncbi:MAG: endonuclease III [Candidatus Lokiarchaeota archaeon]|nr:endonuclease III [Candidatus Lokiarchaeota archaeon]
MNFKEILNKIEFAIEGEAHLDELAKKKQDPFKILISTILSARTRDANTIIATEKLFARYNTPQLIAEAEINILEELVKVSGFYRVKAARIKEVSKRLLEEFNGEVPADFEELINLPGVGAKTANCVLVYAFKIPAIPVDVHVHRIMNRLLMVNTTKPEETEKALKIIIPKEYWIDINRLFVRFGQQICLPNNPKCEICPLNEFCPKDFSMENKMKKKKKRKNVNIIL